MAYLAIDLGAGSGRVIAGFIKNKKLYLDEIHRFSQPPIVLNGTLYWDFLSLFFNIKEGIRLAVKKGYEVSGIGVDTWGVDFGLVDKSGHLLSNPVCYRDQRTSGMADKVRPLLPDEELYKFSGIQQMEINTLYQLFSLAQTADSSYASADKLLFMPDLINYFLTGKSFNEYTIASTSQLLNAASQQWEWSAFETLSLRSDIMQPVVLPGTIIGQLNETVAEQTGAVDARVIAVGAHDTASAIGAISESGDNWAFLSSGTWSLFGVLNNEPVLTEEAYAHAFTNEGGVNGKILFMKNITGLWLLQGLIAEWEKESGEKTDYDQLLGLAAQAKAFASVVNSDDPMFNQPHSMAHAIQEFCRKTNQTIPETKGEFTRCVLESLALKYHSVLTQLQQCSSKSIQKLHIVGGGGRNRLLSQFTANALNMPVTVGLTEGTAVGNIMQQAISLGDVEDWDQAHAIVRESFAFDTYLPEDNDGWTKFIQQKQHLF